MKVKIKPNIRLRTEEFGGIIYVPHRDDFFAIDTLIFDMIKNLKEKWKVVSKDKTEGYVDLAKIGICETDPPTKEISYSRPSFIGNFPELPSVEKPLVVNCFATAHCPLLCKYCHADDLMIKYRDGENENDVFNVLRSAQMIPAMVAVITGGDPLTKPERAKTLIENLYPEKAIVLDTSGVGNIKPLIEILKKCSVHVRVSLDTIDNINDNIRPGNRIYDYPVRISREGAINTIKICIKNNISVSVQTVISSYNDRRQNWSDLLAFLLSLGVKHWVLHIAVKGGKAREIEDNVQKKKLRRGSILPRNDVYSDLWKFVSDVIQKELPIDIRCTDTGLRPNSVLLINNKGELFTEGYAHSGKVKLRDLSVENQNFNALWTHLDKFGHANRYLNWNPWFFNQESLEKICYKAKFPPPKIKSQIAPIEIEAKYKVNDQSSLEKFLLNLGFVEQEYITQRDEYFDTIEKLLQRRDYVIRLRIENNNKEISMKSPRIFSSQGEHSRIEIDIPIENENEVRKSLSKKGLECTWYFEKRRKKYLLNKLEIVIDEIPELGFFCEIEGAIAEIRNLAFQIKPFLVKVIDKNYKELFVEYKLSKGETEENIKGAEFNM